MQRFIYIQYQVILVHQGDMKTQLSHDECYMCLDDTLVTYHKNYKWTGMIL